MLEDEVFFAAPATEPVETARRTPRRRASVSRRMLILRRRTGAAKSDISHTSSELREPIRGAYGLCGRLPRQAPFAANAPGTAGGHRFLLRRLASFVTEVRAGLRQERIHGR